MLDANILGNLAFARENWDKQSMKSLLSTSLLSSNCTFGFLLVEVAFLRPIFGIQLMQVLGVLYVRVRTRTYVCLRKLVNHVVLMRMRNPVHDGVLGNVLYKTPEIPQNTYQSESKVSVAQDSGVKH